MYEHILIWEILDYNLDFLSIENDSKILIKRLITINPN